MINFRELPFYIQFTIKLLMLMLLCVFVIYGKNVVVPLVFSILLSIVLLPVTNFLENKVRVPKTASNFIAVIFALTIIALIIYFFYQQISRFLDDIPTIRRNLRLHFDTIQGWIQRKFGVTPSQQTELVESATGVNGNGTGMIGQTFFTITETLFYIIMVAIYSFLILHYRHMIKRFIIAIFIKAREPEVNEVLLQSKGVVQKYMMGLITEMGIVAVANTVALLIIGVEYAVFLGIFTAILNLIPYIGIISGIIFTSLVSLSTSQDLSDIFWIVISMEVIHFVDSNFLMPYIVGSKVKINALVTIIGVVAGGTLAGLSGIFLALPVIAILKIIFDRMEDMKPWGMLMGDDTDPGKSLLMKRLERINMMRKKKAIHPITPPGETQ